jgi:hypothetical protein
MAMNRAMDIAGRGARRAVGGMVAEGDGAMRSRLMRQRQAFAALEDGPAKEDFRRAVLARAEELLQLNPEAADALLEFLPKDDRDRLLSGFFGD